jgi:hypothetical protein
MNSSGDTSQEPHDLVTLLGVLAATPALAQAPFDL